MRTNYELLQCLKRRSDSISRNETQFRAMLQEHIAGGLLRIDAHTIVGNDCTCCGLYVELMEKESEREEWKKRIEDA